MCYRSGLSEETEREVDPYAIVQGEVYWYALGHCHLRDGRRLFRLDRVLAAEPLAETFERPPGLDTPGRVLESLADMREDRWSVEVLLEATQEEAREQVPTMGVSLEEALDGVLMRSSTSDLGWMARVLAGLSFSFVVRRPSCARRCEGARKRSPRSRRGPMTGDDATRGARAGEGTAGPS